MGGRAVEFILPYINNLCDMEPISFKINQWSKKARAKGGKFLYFIRFCVYKIPKYFCETWSNNDPFIVFFNLNGSLQFEEYVSEEKQNKVLLFFYFRLRIAIFVRFFCPTNYSWSCSWEKRILMQIKAFRYQSANCCHLSEILRSTPFRAR